MKQINECQMTVTALALSLAFLTGCEANRLDRKMEELCKIDGGIKIYETVNVPASWLDEQGYPNNRTFPIRYVGGGLTTQEISDQYIVRIQEKTIVAVQDDSHLFIHGTLRRVQTTVMSTPDRRILGEETTYRRTGGDWSLGHPGSSFCPYPNPSKDVIQSIFKKGA